MGAQLAQAAVYLSYTSQDRDTAQRVVAELRQAGFDIWWDQDIRAGEEFQSRIQRELRDADYIVALVTENYLHSRIVGYEAAAGYEAGKLIPITFGGARLKPPLNQLTAIDGDREDWPLKLVNALRARKAPPSAVRPPARQRSRSGERSGPRIGTLALEEVRVQLFYWLGVGGAVITLAGNLDAFLILAAWIDWINEHWSELITWFWNFIIPFDLHILPEDAVIFTFLVIMFFNLLLTSADQGRNVAAGLTDVLVLLLAVVVAAYIAFVGFVVEFDSNHSGVTDFLMGPLVSFAREALSSGFEAPLLFLGMSFIGVAALGFCYAPVALVFSMRPNIRAFGARLWRILLGVGLVALANQVSLSIQSQNWGDLLRTA